MDKAIEASQTCRCPLKETLTRCASYGVTSPSVLSSGWYLPDNYFHRVIKEEAFPYEAPALGCYVTPRPSDRPASAPVEPVVSALPFKKMAGTVTKFWFFPS